MYADPELLVAEWLRDTLDLKTWADPRLPERWDDSAPLAHVQRTPGGGDTRLTLDAAVLDIEVYSAIADNARTTAGLIWSAMRLRLPRHTTESGAFVTGVTTLVAPQWLPDPKYFRRSATYGVWVHSDPA